MRIRTLDGQIIFGSFRAKAKPKAKDLQNGHEVMAHLHDGRSDAGLYKCTIIEVNGTHVTVSYEEICWDNAQSEKKKPVIKTRHARIRTSAIVCYASEYSWHAKMLSGSAGGAAKVIGLVDPASLEQGELLAR